MEINF